MDVACFHSQQGAEKYLKAFLNECKVDIPRTHYFAPLLELCLQYDADFEIFRSDLDRMEGYGTALRYPGTRATPEMTQSALEIAARVRGKLSVKE